MTDSFTQYNNLFGEMQKKECPSCAMEVEKTHTVCPVCGYEFTDSSKPWLRWVAWLLVILFLLLLLL